MFACICGSMMLSDGTTWACPRFGTDHEGHRASFPDKRIGLVAPRTIEERAWLHTHTKPIPHPRTFTSDTRPRLRAIVHRGPLAQCVACSLSRTFCLNCEKPYLPSLSTARVDTDVFCSEACRSPKPASARHPRLGWQEVVHAN